MYVDSAYPWLLDDINLWLLSHMKVVVCYVNVCIMQLQITLCGGRYVVVLLYWEAKESKFE